MIKVQIIGTLVACKEGMKDSWREVADYVSRQLYARFQDEVEVKYFDLFEKDCPFFPKDTQIPVVLINGELLSSGGKISVPLLRSYIEKKMTLDQRQ